YLKGFRNVASIRKEANDAQTREQLFRLLEDYEKELERHP
ncbi:MAG: tRNA dihydrouridine synthase DusB, partial [Clostridiales bacterium]|nr:tRNA dihydrouridine synthase DusB [Clostridiales bacterium]